jgi:hypothetical protein
MKITKLIREYVEEQVAKVYDTKTNPYSEQAESDRQKLKAFTEELHKLQSEAIEKFRSENELFEYGWGELRSNIKVTTSVPSFNYYYTKAMVDERKWNEENKRNKKEKIREIMLALELGANRQELNDMITKLLGEDV